MKMRSKSKEAEGKVLREAERVVDRYGARLKQSLTKVRDGLAKETDETKEMLDIYYRYTNGKVSEEELQRANEQFRDLLRALGLSIFAILPAAPITIPFFVKLGQMVGVDLLPSAFREKKSDQDTKKKS